MGGYLCDFDLGGWWVQSASHDAAGYVVDWDHVDCVGDVWGAGELDAAFEVAG